MSVLSKSELEAALLSQLSSRIAKSAAQGLKMEDLTQMRLWAAETRMNAMMRVADTPTAWSRGEDYGLDPLSLIHVKYAALKKGDENLLVCPSCGSVDLGNRMNKKPWCIKCNMPLVPKSKLLKWKKKVKTIKAVDKRQALQKDLEKLNPSLNPKEMI